jgi:hypothetical protein
MKCRRRFVFLGATEWMRILPVVVTALIASCPLGVVAQQPGSAASTQKKVTDGRQHPAQSAAAQAGDPTAPVMQFQFTEFFAPSNHNGDGYANVFNFQPVMPISASKKIPVEQVMRVTLPFITTPGPGRISGLGDINYFDLFVPKPRPWGILGAGFTAVFPTASDDELGAGKYQPGPAGTVAV